MIAATVAAVTMTWTVTAIVAITAGRWHRRKLRGA
jgi:hypothetical protein